MPSSSSSSSMWMLLGGPFLDDLESAFDDLFCLLEAANTNVSTHSLAEDNCHLLQCVPFLIHAPMASFSVRHKVHFRGWSGANVSCFLCDQCCSISHSSDVLGRLVLGIQPTLAGCLLKERKWFLVIAFVPQRHGPQKTELNAAVSSGVKHQRDMKHLNFVYFRERVMKKVIPYKETLKKKGILPP